MDDIDFSDVSDEVIDVATNYAGKFVDYVENLPFDLQRNVTRLREIDCTCREVVGEIESLYDGFANDGETKKRSGLVQIQRLLGRCQELGDEKIFIVQQINEIIENRKKSLEHSSYRFKISYRPDQKDEFRREANKVDNHRSKRTRRRQNQYQDKVKYSMMDSGFAKSGSHGNGSSANQPPEVRKEQSRTNKDETQKSEKVEKKEPISMATTVALPVAVVSTLKSTTTKSSTKVTTSSKPSTSSSNGSNKTINKGKKKKKSSRPQLERMSTRSPSPQVDVPIDPDEPTYCVCDQVSFGQMIGCDNKKCPIEWFHFSCVGLTLKPKGRWYCPDCLRDMKCKKKREK
ncbi:inhibitor of growth protein 1 [Ciona intestinalis]